MARRVPYASTMDGQPAVSGVNRLALMAFDAWLVRTQAPGGISLSALAARLVEACRRVSAGHRRTPAPPGRAAPATPAAPARPHRVPRAPRRHAPARRARARAQ